MTEVAKIKTFAAHLDEFRDQRDIYQEMLDHKRSPQTKRAYASDMKDFFGYFGMEPTPATIKEFLGLTKVEATSLVLKWKNHLVERGLKMSSISRKVGSIKALVKFSNDVGACDWVLTSEALICTKGIQKYRDTTGVSPEWINKMLAVPDRSTLIGKRDYAILQLLWSNALRRAEVVSISLEDWDGGRYLWIMGKGRSDKERITLNPNTINALKVWLDARFRYVGDGNEALFISLDRVNKGGRLRDQYVYTLVDNVAKVVGLPKKFSPHRIRHSSITAALDATGGDVRAVQKLSRHSKLEVLMVYDDARLDAQGDISDLLGGMV
ncbi:MAG: tyrosine-type recombinase/integrase [Okeania sp. SIO1H6]|nr:tyrosine-type recombinase/integrase [Okeania sp. SIO1H6]